ncbi:MAG: oligosaccharide flippase family protein [bacterium]
MTIITNLENYNLPSIKQRLLSGGAWALTTKILTGVVFLLMNSLLTRLITPEDLGLYFLVLSIVMFGSLFGEMGLSRVILRFVAESLGLNQSASAKRIIRLVLCLGLVGALGTAIIYILLSDLLAIYVFKTSVLQPVSGLIAGCMIAAILKRILIEIFRGFHDIRLATLFGITAEGFIPGLFLLIGLLIIWCFNIADLQNVVLITGVSGFSTVFLAGWILNRKLKRLPSSNGHNSNNLINTRRVLTVAFPMLITTLISFTLTMQADIWILSIFRPRSEVALYGAAARLISLIGFALMIVNSVVPPIIAELNAQGQTHKLERVLRLTATLAGLPAFIILIILVLFNRWILGFVFGEFYTGAAVVLILLSFGQLANVSAGSCGLTLMMTGNERTIMWLSVFIGIFSIVGGILAASKFGIIGMASVSSARLVLQNILMLIYTKHKVGIWTHVNLSINALRFYLRPQNFAIKST